MPNAWFNSMKLKGVCELHNSDIYAIGVTPNYSLLSLVEVHFYQRKDQSLQEQHGTFVIKLPFPILNLHSYTLPVTICRIENIPDFMRKD